MWWYTLLEKNWQSAHASKLRNANFNHCLTVKIHFIVIFSKSNLIELSQHSRSQARVKEEGCVRFWQTSIKNSHSNGFEWIWNPQRIYIYTIYVEGLGLPIHQLIYRFSKLAITLGFRRMLIHVKRGDIHAKDI